MKTRRKNSNSTPQRSSNPAHYSLISTNPNKNLSLDHFSFKCIYFSLSELVKSIKQIFYLFLLSDLFKQNPSPQALHLCCFARWSGSPQRRSPPLASPSLGPAACYPPHWPRSRWKSCTDLGRRWPAYGPCCGRARKLKATACASRSSRCRCPAEKVSVGFFGIWIWIWGSFWGLIVLVWVWLCWFGFVVIGFLI